MLRSAGGWEQMEKKSRGLLRVEYRSESPLGLGDTIPGVKQAQWPHGAAGPDSQPPAWETHTQAHTIPPRSGLLFLLFLSLPSHLSVRLSLVSLSYVGPLWILPEVQADRGLKDLKIKTSDLGPCPANLTLRCSTARHNRSVLLPPAQVTFQGGREKTAGKLRLPQHQILEKWTPSARFRLERVAKVARGCTRIQLGPFSRFPGLAFRRAFLLTGQEAARTNSLGVEHHTLQL